MSADPVAQPSAPPRPTGVDPGARQDDAVHSQLAGTLHSLARVADLQVAIWLSGLKAAVLQVVLAAIGGVLALLATFVALVFVYAGVFHLLTDFLHIPTAWALLIFAGAHLALAGTFAVTAIWILNRRPLQETSKGDAP